MGTGVGEAMLIGAAVGAGTGAAGAAIMGCLLYTSDAADE